MQIHCHPWREVLEILFLLVSKATTFLVRESKFYTVILLVKNSGPSTLKFWMVSKNSILYSTGEETLPFVLMRLECVKVEG